jgi:hypothetical protein
MRPHNLRQVVRLHPLAPCIVLRSLVALLFAFAAGYALGRRVRLLPASLPAGELPAWVREAEAFIQAHGHRRVGVKEVAAQLRISTKTLERRTRALGLTSAEFIRRRTPAVAA